MSDLNDESFGVIFDGEFTFNILDLTQYKGPKGRDPVGGFQLGNGGIVFGMLYKPSQEVIDNHKQMFNWDWVDFR